ncbi:MAG: Nramp family divalent metal transporter [Bacteroidota bacterium]|nr:Nramp family divalent metal transporter [Bacteroidota bacterium]
MRKFSIRKNKKKTAAPDPEKDDLLIKGGHQSLSETSSIQKVNQEPKRNIFRVLGLGLITGAADDDPSAIGTYASAGAKLGPSILWVAPVLYPMMFVVVYLSSKLGQVTGRGLFHVIRRYYSKWLFYPMLIGVLIGNIIEAGADIGGMAAAIHLLVPIPQPIIVIITTLAILTFQIWGSYVLIRNIFRWLALVLLAYIASALLAKPDLMTIIRGTLIPSFSFNHEFLSLLVAIIGTTISAYLTTWQSNEEVEEEIAMGRKRLWQRAGATNEEIKKSQWDIASGMFFANLVMYFIILSTASTLFKAGKTDIETAVQAAQALEPFAGKAAELLFSMGVVAVGFLAVPIMTTGAAYDLCQTVGWKYGLHTKPREAPKFYLTIAFFSFVAMGMNFLGINPMKALVFSGIVQGFSTPPLLLLILLMTNKREVMGLRVNSRTIMILGWITVILIFSASLFLFVSWFI